MTEVLVLVERAPGAGIRKSSLELLAIAGRLGEPGAVLCEPADPTTVELLARYGARSMFDADAPELADYLVVPKVELLAQLVQARSPLAVLITSNPEGKEIAGRLAVRLGSGVITDAVDVTPSPTGPVATQSVFAGSWMVRGRVRRGVPVITVRPNAAAPTLVSDPAVLAPARVTTQFSAAARGARVIRRTPIAKGSRPELSEATTVVTGGRGVGSANGFAVIERLADTLGAAVGATRAVTDQNWRPHEMQIGQTGKTVAPQLYLACGVSGAVQHLAGMQSSRTIVAVNKDAAAPIFAVADFGIVGDLHAVLPDLIGEIEKRKEQQS